MELPTVRGSGEVKAFVTGFYHLANTWHILIFYILYYKHILDLGFLREPSTCQPQNTMLHTTTESCHPWDGLLLPLIALSHGALPLPGHCAEELPELAPLCRYQHTAQPC